MVATNKDLMKEMAKVKEFSPGEDGIRLGVIRNAPKEIQDVAVLKVKGMWNTSATLWEEPLKVGVMIQSSKKGDKADPDKYRGIYLLILLSKVLGRKLVTIVRVWAEEMNLLDEDQARIRKGRSTADTTQIFIRIQDD